LEKIKVSSQLADSSRFSAGDDQAIETVQLGRQTNLYSFYAHPFQHGNVLDEIPLKGKNTNSHITSRDQR
jgi:hypothetical protein